MDSVYLEEVIRMGVIWHYYCPGKGGHVNPSTDVSYRWTDEQKTHVKIEGWSEASIK